MLWVVLFSLTVPFEYNFLPWPGDWNWVKNCCEWMVRYSARIFISQETPYEASVISDSTGMYVHAFNILLLALVITLAWTFFFSQIRSHRKLHYWFTVYVRYFLSLQLLIYGFSKVFKAQFYLPEPNILYTPVGQLYPDILYWSSMGVSRSYSMFLGIVEVIAALLLLFRRTTIVGALAALLVMINVTAINMAYDISVKFVSLFLLLLSIYLLAREAKRIIPFISGKAVAASTQWQPQWKGNSRMVAGIVRAVIRALLIYESLSLYLHANNFNDDKMPRPYLHGAWEVKTFVAGNDTLPPLLTDSIRWRRVFVHRQGYFIIQKMDDQMMDYEMEINRASQQIYLQSDTGRDTLSFNDAGNGKLYIQTTREPSIKITLEKIDWQKLPALKKEFNWRIDAYEQ
jgi:hypothetical protein